MIIASNRKAKTRPPIPALIIQGFFEAISLRLFDPSNHQSRKIGG